MYQLVFFIYSVLDGETRMTSCATWLCVVMTFISMNTLRMGIVTYTSSLGLYVSSDTNGAAVVLQLGVTPLHKKE